jgi:hypothetical protein
MPFAVNAHVHAFVRLQHHAQTNVVPPWVCVCVCVSVCVNVNVCFNVCLCSPGDDDALEPMLQTGVGEDGGEAGEEGKTKEYDAS